ncbi:MAG: hypothetical protein R3B13_23315 [Polyangiaceae bacterium]
MKFRFVFTVLGAGLAAAMVAPPSADAAPVVVLGQKKPAKAKAPPPPAGPARMKKRIGLSPRGVAWGINLVQLAKIYDKVFDKEFVPLYKKVSAGPRMAALDAELENKKAILRRSRVNFGTLPTGIDQSALKGEYSYENGESLARLPLRSGTVRNFFFFGDKLWLIYDEHKLRSGGPYGETFEEAVKILSKKFGEVEPEMVEPDYANGRNFQEARWTDGSIIVRAINREYQKTIGMAYADASVWNNLSKYRKNKPKDPHALDKDVALVTRKAEPEKPPSEEPKKKGKKK